MYIDRHIEQVVLNRSKDKGAIVVTGARQVGKTTLIERIKPDIQKVSFDDIFIRHRAIDEPAAFFQLNPPPIFIDEVQYVPDIFPYIKILLDKSHHKGDFFLTGSQSFELMNNVTESLAGRGGILELYGLSLREIRSESWNEPFIPSFDYLMKRKEYSQKENSSPFTIGELWKIIHRGSMPELVAQKSINWQDFYSDYIRTYLERDVSKLTQVADERQFINFIRVCAAMTGNLLNLASIARDVGISEPTAKRWLSVLRTSGIIYLLESYSNNAITRAVKTPKIYFMDTGLAAYLTRWLSAETLSQGAMSGHFFETFVVTEIIKSYTNAGKPADFYFLRDGNGREIDLLIFQNNTLFPLEMKQRINPSTKDISSFSILDTVKNVDIGEGGVICPSLDLLPLSDKHRIIPVAMI